MAADRAPSGSAPRTHRSGAQSVAPASESEAETRRLAESGAHRLRPIASGWSARLGTLERNLEDVTGSIKRQAREPATAAPPAPAAAVRPTRRPRQRPWRPAVTAPVEASAHGATAGDRQPRRAAAVTADTAGRRSAAGDPAAAQPVATRAELGVDVGGARISTACGCCGASTKGNNAALFEGLHPVVAVRENSRTKAVELRLIAGPLANAEAAARICATLSAARRYCQPVAFEGQRLAQADVVPERKPAAAPRAAPRTAPNRVLPFR